MFLKSLFSGILNGKSILRTCVVPEIVGPDRRFKVQLFRTRRLLASCPEVDHVVISDLATYIHSEINGTFDDIFKKLDELIDILELPNSGSITKVTLSDARLLSEEIGACPSNLESFLQQLPTVGNSLVDWEASQDAGAISPSLHNDFTIEEYDKYPTDKDLISLARKCGAKLEYPKS